VSSRGTFTTCGIATVDDTGRAVIARLCPLLTPLGINTAIASVVLGVTSFGVIFYLSIVATGAVSVNCPYQIPGSRVILAPAVLAAVQLVEPLSGAPVLSFCSKRMWGTIIPCGLEIKSSP